MTAVEDLDRLRAAAQAAADKAARAEAAAERVAAEAAARRDARLREWDEKTLADFDAATVTADVDRTFHDVESAIVNGANVHSAWLTYQVAHRDAWQLVSEANAAAARLGRPPVAPLPGSVREDLAPVVHAVIAREANRRADEQAQFRYNARERYADNT